MEKQEKNCRPDNLYYCGILSRMRRYTGSILAAERKCGIQFTLPQHCTLRSSTLCMVYAIQYRAVCKPRQNHDRHEIPSGVWQNCSGSAGGEYHMEKRKPAAVS